MLPSAPLPRALLPPPQDRRLALLLCLMARCALDAEIFGAHALAHVLRGHLACEDVRARYYAGVYLLKHWMLNQQDRYWRSLRQLIVQVRPRPRTRR